MLDRNQNSIDQMFRQGLEEASMPVSNRAWSGISTELENDRLKKRLAFYQLAAGFALLMLLGLGLWSVLDRGSNAPSSNIFASARGFEQIESWGHGPDYCDPAGAPAKLNPNYQVAERSQVQGSSETPSNSANNALLAMERPGLTDKMPVLAAAIDKQKLNFDVLRAELSARVPVIANTPKQQRSKNFFSAAETPKSIIPAKKEKEFAYLLDDEDGKGKQEKHWDLGATLSPDVMFGSTTPTASYSTSRSSALLDNDPLSASSSANSPVTVFSTGMRAAYEFNDRFAVRAGVLYSNRQTVASSSLPSYGKQAVYQSNLSLHYLEVPVTMKYNLLHLKNFDYFVSGGVSGNMFLYYDNYLQNGNGEVNARKVSEKSESFKPSQANLLVSTGMQYRMFDRLSMAIEPGLRYGVKTNEYAFSQSKPLSLSLTSGVSYHF